jgi:hypothetical protein
VDVDKIKERYLEQYGAKPTEKALKVETKLATGPAVRRREEANKPVVEALAELAGAEVAAQAQRARRAEGHHPCGRR